MAPKRREQDRSDSHPNRGDRESIADGGEDEDAVSTSGEQRNLSLASRAFEHATQVYRYMRDRHNYCPVFMHRNLTYMRPRMSRTHARRKNFRVDDILENVKDVPVQFNAYAQKYLTITFIGYYDTTRNLVRDCNEMVKIETLVEKSHHNKRKDIPPSSKSVKLSIGTSEVPVNPSDDVPQQVPIISIPPDVINIGSTKSIKAYVVLMRVVKDNGAQYQDNDGNSIGGGFHIYDKKSNIMAAVDGEYQVSMQLAPFEKNSPNGHQTWTYLGQVDQQDSWVPCDIAPSTKFRMQWTTEPSSGWVERPIPVAPPMTAMSTRNGSITNGDNKENHPTVNSRTPFRSHNRPSVRPRAAKKKPPGQPIYYYFQVSPTKSVPTESHNNFICPWCVVDCMELDCLLMHLRHGHSRFNFSYAPTEDNGVRINVSVNDLFNGSYEGNPINLIDSYTHAYCVNGPVRRAPNTGILVCRPKRSHFSLSEFTEMDGTAELEMPRPVYVGHNRLYYHTTTCLPIYPQEMDYDSEGEKDPTWLKEKTIQMIDDFTDVNEGEKEIMKMWNLHVMKFGFVGDCQVPLACSMFIELRGKEIVQKNLYRNMILHLCNLFDFGLLSPPQVYKFIRQIQDVYQSLPENVRVFAETWTEQRLQWVQSGGLEGSRDKMNEKFPAYPVTTPNSNSRLTSSSTFITGDGTLRRKMNQQTPQVQQLSVKKERRQTTVSSKTAPPQVDEDDDLSTKTKRKLSLEEKIGDEPAKRKRSGSMPSAGAVSGACCPARRKSSAPGDQTLRKPVPS